MQTHPRLHYRPDIDGLRAIAIVSVVVFHAFPHWASGGFVGVDVFFVISGYLITGLILRALAVEPGRTGGFSLRSFYAHRIRRLFPALILVLISCLVFGWFVLLAEEYKQLGKQVVAGIAFVENLSLLGEAGYFDTAAELKPLLHLWSLGIEEQFYFVWPLTLMAAVRLRLHLFTLICGIGVLSFSANVLTIGQHADAAFYSPVTRMWELMMGGMLAHLQVHGAPKQWKHYFSNFSINLESSKALCNIQSGVGLCLILLAVFLLDKRSVFPGWWALLPTLGTFLLISGGPEAWVNRVILSSRLFVFVGLVSYPFYLWHWPLLSFLRILKGSVAGDAPVIAAIVLAFALACLTYWLVERRLRFHKHWMVTIALSCAVLPIAGAGYNIFSRDGLEFRLKDSELQRFKFNTTLTYQAQCRRDFEFAKNSFCLRGDANIPPTVALIGDSHAMNLYAGLGSYYAQRGENLVHFGTGGGIPFYGVERVINGHATEHYAKLYASILDYVSNGKQIKTVILFNKTLSLDQAEDSLRDEFDYANSNRLDIYGKAMERTLKKLLEAKKEVIFVVDAPAMDFDPGACVPRPSGLLAIKSPCAMPREKYDRQTYLYRQKVADVLKRFPAVRVWNLADSLCDTQYCWAMKDGKMLYARDGHHLTMVGSYWLVDRFAPQ